MSDDFDDFFFADSPSFSPDESGDKQFLKTPSSGFHETINTSTLNDDDFEWFIGKAGADGYQVKYRNCIPSNKWNLCYGHLQV